MRSKEHKIGESFGIVLPNEIEIEVHLAEMDESIRCDSCVLKECCIDLKDKEPCTGSRRSDGTDVVFRLSPYIRTIHLDNVIIGK